MLFAQFLVTIHGEVEEKETNRMLKALDGAGQESHFKEYLQECVRKYLQARHALRKLVSIVED